MVFSLRLVIRIAVATVLVLTSYRADRVDYGSDDGTAVSSGERLPGLVAQRVKTGVVRAEAPAPTGASRLFSVPWERAVAHPYGRDIAAAPGEARIRIGVRLRRCIPRMGSDEPPRRLTVAVRS
jgi:hypothetical protein